MRSIIPVLGLVYLSLSPTAVPAQTRRNDGRKVPWHASRSDRDRADRTSSRLGTSVFRRRVNAFGTNRSFGLSTRPERLRTELRTRFITRRRKREHGLLSIEPPAASPIAQLLERRNLLRSHSTLAKSRSTLIGRQDYILDQNGHWRGEITPVESQRPVQIAPQHTATDASSYPTLLSEQLKKKADEYYRLGMIYFREKQYSKSQQYFGLVRQLERKRPRAFVADVIVSYQRLEVNTAIISLVRAIQRAESLDDLRIEWKELYATEQEFRRVVESVNLLAKSRETIESVSLLLAYYAWLNGDTNTAIAAAQAATGSIQADVSTIADSDTNMGSRGDNPLTAAAKRFRELLTEARDQADASNGGG